MAYLGEYIAVGWENEPSQKTPINAYNLGIMEEGIKRLFYYLLAGGGTGSGNGTEGREIELRNNGEYIQWRYVGDEEWIDLVSLGALKGVDGVGITSIQQTVTSNEDGGTNQFVVMTSDGKRTNLFVKNGSKGSSGDDYVLTEEDIEEIAQKAKVESVAEKISYDDTDTNLGADNVQAAIGKLSGQKVDKTGIMLATHTDGLIYLFVDGKPVGIGLDLSSGGTVEPDTPDTPDEPVEEFSSFKFIQLSDTHYQYSQDATAIVVSNINALSDVDFVTNSGDITVDTSRDDTIKATELEEYKTNFRDKLDIPIYPCVGGHDLCTNTDEIWRTYTGMERLHELVHKDCVFLFADCLLTGWLDWLETKVATHTGKRIFIFEHHPIENEDFTVGLKDGETRVTWNNSDMSRILELLRNNHNVMWFTGHTHWAFGTAVNDVYNDNGLMGTIVHTPFLNAYQGWEVNVNDNATILKGVSFSETGMTYLGEDYNYTIEQDITDYGEAEIVTEGETVEVGGETNISVYLATKPSRNQVVNISTNDIISTNVSNLTFTPENYNIPQIVKVTGNSVGTGRLILNSNSKTTVRKIDVVEGSAIINYFNPSKPLTKLGSYYGTGASASYQLSNLIPAKTGDTVKSNALGSQTSYRLKMFDADFNYIAEAQNNVQSINYTITEENVEYVSVVYRGVTVGQADTIMVTVNQDLPSDYVAYNGNPVGYTITNYADVNNPSQVNKDYTGAYYALEDSDGTNVSNLIPCDLNDAIYVNFKSTTHHVYMFDENSELLEREIVSMNGVTVENENAKYIAVSYDNTSTDLMVMKNQKAPGYYVATTDTM